MLYNIKEIVSELSLEEKAQLCSGKDFWSTKAIERLNIPSIWLTDGPHGLRKPLEGGPEHGIGHSAPATCFPSGAGLAATWNTDLVEQVGRAIGEEAQSEGVQIVLGPALNIKRSPLCGRNFEYFSEDPYLSGEMAIAHINGVQSQGVGTSVKHYAVNNKEHRRMSMNAIVDERSLREIYLVGFEKAVKQSKPWTVMAAYNKVNGTYATEHPYLLKQILRDEWGFEGVVVSDWLAVNERVDALKAGLDLEMPGNGGYGDRKIVEAVEQGHLTMEELDLTVERLLKVLFEAIDKRKVDAPYSIEEHLQLARQVAAESMVLLKNDDNVLPICKQSKVAVIGELAKKPRYQGGGSSHIVTTKMDTPWHELIAGSSNKVEWDYAQGYELENDVINDELIQEAVEIASKAECAIVFIGLPDRYESEGYDRTHMSLPANHNYLIDAIAQAQPNLIVLLSNGSPVEMPWIHKAKAVLEAYLGGQAAGGAIADIVFGHVNPSGKLAETFPRNVRQNPSSFNFPGDGDEVVYHEGLLVGYRYYDTMDISPLFAFGHGLSYTTFEYSQLVLDKEELDDTETVKVTLTVKNRGEVKGKEVVQLYVKDLVSSVARPEKELKAFCKVELMPGEEKQVEFVLDKRAFAYYNTVIKDWHVESGKFDILVGGASDSIALQTTLQVNSTVSIPNTFTRQSTFGDLMADPVGAEMINAIRQGGRMQNNPSAENEANNQMMIEVMKSMPLRSLVVTSRGALTDEKLDQMLNMVNKS